MSFIPLAEETGIIVPLGRWVIRESLAQLQRLREEIAPHLTMSVNLSAQQLLDDRIVLDVATSLEAAMVEPSALTLELTETTLVDDPVFVARLAHLRALGVNLAADDFGSGFASYSALQQMPFTMVKIDRSLIQNLTRAPDNRAAAQVRSIIEMAQATGLQVVAEGVESHEQLCALGDMGCNLAQGFYFARPAPDTDLDLVLTERLPVAAA
jgi:EAL domain-containing protein (putative c-di-GMP-specific phosphodiesterase class I)